MSSASAAAPERKSKSVDSAASPKKFGKVITLIERKMKLHRPFFSFEYFVPKTAPGLRNLYARLDRMCRLEPLFMDCTWGAGGSTARLTHEISANIQTSGGKHVMMHLTCTNMPKGKVKIALEKAKAAG